MEKTLSLGAFEELSENEIMVTEGGASAFTIGRGIVGAVLAVGAIVAAPVTGPLLFAAVATGTLAVCLSGADY